LLDLLGSQVVTHQDSQNPIKFLFGFR
jgi:hypothetical protein